MGDSIDMIKIRNCFADWKNVHWIVPFPLHYPNAFITYGDKTIFFKDANIKGNEIIAQVKIK